jgi:hypothetical protein
MTKQHIGQITIFILYILVMTGIMVWQGIGIDPSRYIFVLFVPAFIFKKTRPFLLDWTPFIFILLSYDFLRGLAPLVNDRVDYFTAINFDSLFGGQIPTITLQRLFYSSGHLHWWDYLTTVLYFIHFALPLAFGYILWLLNKAYFKTFVLGISLLSYAGWVTYVIFPAAPPWLASDNGLIPHVTKIIDTAVETFPDKLDLPSIYHNFNPNSVAAIPSMHAAYPMIVLLFAYKFFGKKALFFLPYVLTVWFGLVYLGEHYVFDLLAGAVYAIVFYLVAIHARSIVKFIPWLKKGTVKI